MEEKKKQTNKQTNKHGLQSAPSTRKGEVYDTFGGFCELTRACTREQILTEPQTRLTCHHALVNPASVSQQVLEVVFLIPTFLSSLTWFHLLIASCSPFSTVLCCSLLLTDLLLDLHSLVLPVLWEISCAGSLCGFGSEADRGILWLAPTHTNTTNVQHSVTLLT